MSTLKKFDKSKLAAGPNLNDYIVKQTTNEKKELPKKKAVNKKKELAFLILTKREN